MKIAAIENPRSRQEELGQFLTAMPVAYFMASMFGPCLMLHASPLIARFTPTP